jgi:hypothetical protein
MAPASELACRLAREAQAVCRHYLSNGRREGRYWLVGDVRNTPGRSMFVRLKGPDFGRGAAGRWQDSATGEYGDLLDVIRESCCLIRFHDIVDEARRFLALPRAESDHGRRQKPASSGSSESARRLFGMSQPISGTLLEAYLRKRGVTSLRGAENLRFHPHCYCRPDRRSRAQSWPAMIAAVTSLDGEITGAHRTWLDPLRQDKAPIDTPRRAMGHLLGHGVRFGMAQDCLAAGEGIETMLSLRCVLPALPMIAALSAGHLSAILFPAKLRRLYVARDRDPAGDKAAELLIDRAQAAGIEAILLSPTLGDFNDDLRASGVVGLREILRGQMALDDMARFGERTSGLGVAA